MTNQSIDYVKISNLTHIDALTRPTWNSSHPNKAKRVKIHKSHVFDARYDADTLPRVQQTHTLFSDEPPSYEH